LHDKDLIKGILDHGFGNWEEICKDSTLGFKAVWETIVKKQAKQQLVFESSHPSFELIDFLNIF